MAMEQARKETSLLWSKGRTHLYGSSLSYVMNQAQCFCLELVRSAFSFETRQFLSRIQCRRSWSKTVKTTTTFHAWKKFWIWSWACPRLQLKQTRHCTRERNSGYEVGPVRDVDFCRIWYDSQCACVKEILASYVLLLGLSEESLGFLGAT